MNSDVYEHLGQLAATKARWVIGPSLSIKLPLLSFSNDNKL
nr:MAG TPA: hypothetical protein [Caudoviricetes sp.]